MYLKSMARLLMVAVIGLFALLSIASHSAAEMDPSYGVTKYQNATVTILFRTGANPGECPPADAELGPLQAWPTEAQAAMSHVADILDDLINSAVPIVIDACYQTDNTPGSLAFAGATTTVTKADVPSLPVADVTYAIALANAISGSDQNGAQAEISTSINSLIDWDYCTTNCTVDGQKFDFVSTVIHEILHGLGFSMTFEVDDANSPTSGSYGPDITDSFVYTYNNGSIGQRLIDLPNNSASLLNAFLGGSGTVVFNGPNTKAANDGNPAFIYSTTNWESGSSMSHLDDNHPTNLGRMMNAATGEGPSSRTIDAITLMFLKDIGWSVNEQTDLSDGTSYPLAAHFVNSNMVNHLTLGASVTTESSPSANDSGDDGVAKVGEWSTGVDGGTVAVTVQAGDVGARGCLNGWADWNNNQSFEDDGEQILSNVPVGAGVANHSFTIPGSVGDGFYTYRFRLHQDWDNDGQCNDQVDVTSTITLMNGEVEDYPFSLTPIEYTDFIYLPLVLKAD